MAFVALMAALVCTLSSLLKDIVHFALHSTHIKSSLVPQKSEPAGPSESLKQSFMVMHLTCRDIWVACSPRCSQSCPGSKVCPCCTGYSPASGWLQYPQCCFWKEDPEISDNFQPPSLQKHLPAAKSLQERLRNKTGMEIRIQSQVWFTWGAETKNFFT